MDSKPRGRREGVEDRSRGVKNYRIGRYSEQTQKSDFTERKQGYLFRPRDVMCPRVSEPSRTHGYHEGPSLSSTVLSWVDGSPNLSNPCYTPVGPGKSFIL